MLNRDNGTMIENLGNLIAGAQAEPTLPGPGVCQWKHMSVELYVSDDVCQWSCITVYMYVSAAVCQLYVSEDVCQ